MRILLDTSVLLAASGSRSGASRELFRLAAPNGWILLVTSYILEEVLANLPGLPPAATADWARLRPRLELVDDVLTLERVTLFQPAKDRPILFSALAWADVLLTLDRADFGPLIESEFYGLRIQTPGMFLQQQRSAGPLLEP